MTYRNMQRRSRLPLRSTGFALASALAIVTSGCGGGSETPVPSSLIEANIDTLASAASNMERHELAGIGICSFPWGCVAPVSFGPEELGAGRQHTHHQQLSPFYEERQQSSETITSKERPEQQTSGLYHNRHYGQNCRSAMLAHWR